jgi:hypothetical protein
LFRNGSLLWPGTALIYNDTAIVNDILYTHSVAAENDIGWSANSIELSSTPSGTVAIPPGVPTGLEVESGDGEVILEWLAPVQSGTAAITGYKVYAVFPRDL